MKKTSPFMTFAKLVVIVMVGAGGWILLSDFTGARGAKIRGMAPGGKASENFHCRLTLEFKKSPPGINQKDVKVVFSSGALEAATTFDWDFMAQNAQVPSKSGTGREPAANISPDKNPPQNYPIDIYFPLVPKTCIETNEPPLLKAELFWGGKKQCQTEASAGFLCERE